MVHMAEPKIELASDTLFTLRLEKCLWYELSPGMHLIPQGSNTHSKSTVLLTAVYHLAGRHQSSGGVCWWSVGCQKYGGSFCILIIFGACHQNNYSILCLLHECVILLNTSMCLDIYKCSLQVCLIAACTLQLALAHSSCFM